jgi:hypothetical protein
LLPGSDLRLPGSEVLRGPALLCAGPDVLPEAGLLCSSGSDLLQRWLPDRELLPSPGFARLFVRRSHEGCLL